MKINSDIVTNDHLESVCESSARKTEQKAETREIRTSDL